MSDNQKLQIAITAVNQASAALKQVATDADAMGKQVETAGKRGAAGLDELKKRGAEVGGAIGTVVAGMSLAGQAAVNNRREVDALNRVYGDSSQQIQDYARELQDLTNFSDEQGRQAALTSATLQRSYGLSTDAIEKLISRSADLAQVYGRELPDVIERTSAALRGEAEGVEVLGVTLNDTFVASQAAARGLTGWTTTMSDAEKAQFRFQLLLEQTNSLQGASEDAADGARGKIIDLKDSVQDATVAFGEFLGPAGEALSVLGQLALGAPVAGAALGKIWTGIGGASGLGTLARFAGPAALIAGGASLAYGYAQEGDGTTATNTFWNNFFIQGSNVLNALLPGNPYDTKKYTDQMDFNEKIDVINQLFRAEGEGQGQAYEDVARLLGLGYDQKLPQGMDGSKYVVPSKEEIVAEIEQRAAASGMGMNDYLQQQARASGLLYDPNTRTYVTRDQRLASIPSAPFYSQSPGTSGLERAAGFSVGPTAPYFPFREGANPQADYLGYQAEIQEIQGQIDTALLDYLHSGAVDAIDLLRSAYPGAPINRMRGAVGGFTAEDQTQVGPEFYGANYTPFDVQAERSGQARSNFQTGYNVTIGQTQGMASDSQGLADFTMGLVNEEGVLGQWDDLVSRGVIDLATQQWASYAEVQGEANRIFATNADIQDDVAVIQLKQLGYMADLQEEYGKTIDEISKMDEAEQRRTLAMMDSSEQAKVSEAATIAYRVATGELAEGIGTDLIKGMAQADPLFADLAEQYGLISYGAEGEIIVNFPDKDSLIEGVGELNDNLANLIELLANYFEINITSNAGDRAAELAGIVSLLNGLDGRSTTYYVNEVRTGISIGNPNGPSITPGDYLGGVVGYAMGGLVTVKLAEAGPELLHFRDGGTALASQSGVYQVPQGTYVDTAPATKGKMANARREATIHISGPVYIYPATGDLHREITANVIGMWRE